MWDGLVELGVVGLLVAEEHGGAGMGMVDAAVVLEELGRAVCPAPYAASAIGAVSLADADLLPPGRRLDDRHGRDLRARHPLRVAAPATRATRDGDAWRLDGTKVHVADAVRPTSCS